MIREQKKEGRRRIILHSAEALVRDVGSTDFSMRQLAQQAQMSAATVYNLFGSKASVLYALLNRSLDRIDTTRLKIKSGEDPVEHVFQAADVAVDLYTADAGFNKPLQKFLVGENEPRERLAYMQRAFWYWLSVSKPLFDASIAPSHIELDGFARDLQFYFAGVLLPWIHDDMDDIEFRSQIRYGVGLRLLALGSERHKVQIANVLLKSCSVLQNVQQSDARERF